MQYSCPRCHSDNTSSFPMIYNSGTTTGRFSAISYGEGTGLIGTGGKTRSQSLLAQQAAPPPPPKDSRFLVLAVVAIIGFIVVFPVLIVIAIEKNISVTLVVAITILLYVAFSFFYYRFNQESANLEKQLFQVRYADWSQSWMCLKCGNAFISKQQPQIQEKSKRQFQRIILTRTDES